MPSDKFAKKNHFQFYKVFGSDERLNEGKKLWATSLKNFSSKTVEISHVGSKGEGTSKLYTEFDYIDKEYVFFIPFSLPSEKIIVQPISKSSEGVRGNILEIINSSTERIEPQCNHFFKCGGCILQHWKFESYNKWKINKLSFPINLISPETEIKSMITSQLKSLSLIHI